MNLEELNLVELNAQEVQDIEGGCPVCLYLECESHVRDFLRGLLDL
ncbi:hypothetical protein [Flavobacterium zhairuonense]|nr:hypothetical protein [Flavobacterium zhairuonense]